MTIIDGLILGIIQGLTEFLPISSSGHLVLVQDILELELPGNDFEILLHLGTLCSILVVFFKDIKSIFSTISSKKTQKFILMIFIGTIPAVIIGLGLKDSIEQLFDDLLVVGFALIFTCRALVVSVCERTSAIWDCKLAIFELCVRLKPFEVVILSQLFEPKTLAIVVLVSSSVA